MYKSVHFKKSFLSFIFLMMSTFLFTQSDQAPSITAAGRQAFCIGNPIKIVSDFTITDPDDTTIADFFIQISSGYLVGFDELELTGNHPNINFTWNRNEGKLTLTSSISGSEMLLTELENAVKDITFKTSSNNFTSEKVFSLSIGDANYLPSTDHFYEFVDVPNITWSDAKIAAENRTYFGRRGYLATLTNQEEANFAGKQAAGAGWIGGSDEETEGEWKWVTGPEAGTVFWRGQVNGTTPNFAFWNNNEPNDFRGNDPVGEDYAHITDPSIGVQGAWNDLPNQGGTGLYIPRGYIVEYGIPIDQPLNIVATTSIYIPQISSTTNATICESGTATISATSNEGTILWFDSQTGGTQLGSGSSFTTANLTTSDTYFAAVSIDGCTTLPRTAVNVTVNERPIITNITEDLICSGIATLSAEASAGVIFWYQTATSTTPIFTGQRFTTPALNNTTSYYVEANNSNCKSNSRTIVTAVVDTTIPEFDLVENRVILCADIGSVDLETENEQGNYSYIWSKDGAILTGNSTPKNVSSPGTYTVKAISEAGCESLEQTIIVRTSEKATITKNDVLIKDDSDNNSIQVINLNLGSGNYQFAIDDEFGIYKDNGFFENLSIGMHTLFVRDIGGCETESFVFLILAYPKFFTPNKDTVNDSWNISGFDKAFFTSSEVLIFDRYGVLIYTIDENTKGWDGTYNGKNLPSNSYWFKATLTDINGFLVEKIGNFSLIR